LRRRLTQRLGSASGWSVARGASPPPSRLAPERAEDSRALYIALSIEGRAVGTLGPMAAFSLNSTKNSPAGGWRALRHGLRGALRPRGAGQVRRPRAVEMGRDHPLDDEADSHATNLGQGGRFPKFYPDQPRKAVPWLNQILAWSAFFRG